MRIVGRAFLFIVLPAILIPAIPAMAQNRPFQLSLVTPIQIIPEQDTISGLRINLIYGRNAAVNGLDWGLVNHTTAGPSSGMQMGLVCITDEVMHGGQEAFVTVAKGDIAGFQGGFINYSNRIHGYQFGIFNYAKRAHGFQFGFINYAASLTGLQLGLINIIAQGGQFPVFPILNWSF